MIQDGTYIYSCGGFAEAGGIETATNECWSLEFSLVRKDWKQMTSMSDKRQGASADILNVRNRDRLCLCIVYCQLDLFLGWKIDGCWWKK